MMKSKGVDSYPAPASYDWARRGDVNAFFGLMLDNIGVMILMGSLLVAAFKWSHVELSRRRSARGTEGLAWSGCAPRDWPPSSR